MRIKTLTITGTEQEINQIQSIADKHELQSRSAPVEVGKHKLEVSKNDQNQRLDHFLHSVGFQLELDLTPMQDNSDVSYDDIVRDSIPNNLEID